jgi:dienelactone hydrolase
MSRKTLIFILGAFSFFLASCTSVGRDIDFDKLSTKDFDGAWQGTIVCKGTGGKLSRSLEVTIKDGQAKLSHLGNWGTHDISTITANGVVSWNGTYDNHQGNKNKPWSARGYWDREVLYIRATRGPRRCNGPLRTGTENIPGLKSRTVRFTSYDPEDYAPIYRKDWKINEHKLRAKLFYKDSDSPLPLVVLLHGFGGQGGATHFFRTIPIKIAEAGGASLTITHKLSIDIPGRVVDTFMAINEAVKNPIVDPNRIYIVGLSAGGMQGLHMMIRPIHKELNTANFTLAGMVLAYPNCRAKFEETDVLPIPTLLLTGAHDNDTPGDQCIDFIKEADGYAFMKHIRFPDAGHSWMFSKRAQTSSGKSWSPCGRLHIDKEGYWHWYGSNETTSSKELGFYGWLEKTDGICPGHVVSKRGRVNDAYDKTVEHILDMIR